MIIRVFLILAVGLLLFWFLQQRISTRAQAWSKIVAILVCLIAVIAILLPNTTNRIAHFVGVGRGADLLLYILTIVVVSYLLVHYLHRRDDQAKVIQLARRVAIIEANQAPHNQAAVKRLQTQK